MFFLWKFYSWQTFCLWILNSILKCFWVQVLLSLLVLCSNFVGCFYWSQYGFIYGHMNIHPDGQVHVQSQQKRQILGQDFSVYIVDIEQVYSHWLVLFYHPRSVYLCGYCSILPSKKVCLCSGYWMWHYRWIDVGTFIKEIFSNVMKVYHLLEWGKVSKFAPIKIIKCSHNWHSSELT